MEDEDESDDVRANECLDQTVFSAEEFSAIKGMDNVSVPDDALDAATVHLTSAICAATKKAFDSLKKAIEKLKKMDVVVVTKAVAEWIKAHPWETAAIVIPLILLACTPAFLGLAGFTAGGVAAGMC